MKLTLHEHISRLLYDHECVIVPGFGAFLTRYYAAEVNHATHMMRPPSRRVYFNSSIRENEGLLAKAISHTENISYSVALENIASEVAQWRTTLNGGAKLNLSGIGRLYVDEASGKIQFSPSLEINYAPESYGLSIFRSPAIQREVEIRKTLHKAIEKHVVIEHPETKAHKVAGWIPWAAALGPVILASVIGYSYFMGSGSGPVENMAGINWLQFSRPAQTEVLSKEVASEPSLKDKEEVQPTVKETSPKALQAEKAIEHNSYPYHIVVGSFKEVENAETYIAHLQSKGVNAYLAQGDKRFIRVAVGDYATHEEASQALVAVKQNIHPQSWVYRN